MTKKTSKIRVFTIMEEISNVSTILCMINNSRISLVKGKQSYFKRMLQKEGVHKKEEQPLIKPMYIVFKKMLIRTDLKLHLDSPLRILFR